MGIAEQIQAVWSIDADAGAVEFEGAWTTWGALRDLAGALDSALTAGGVPPGAPVGLVLRNHPSFVAALLSGLVSRRCALTLSPHVGERRLADDVAALRPPALVASHDDWERPGLRDAVRSVGALGLALGAASVTVVEKAGAPTAEAEHAALADVAVLMLTSGTTGAPKRVPLRAQALERSLLGARHYERERERPRQLRSGVAIVNAPLVHVSGLFRVLQCVCDGRAFALLERFDVARWLELVARHRPQTASLVPTALRMILAAVPERAALASLKSVISGTAPLEPETALEFERRYGIPVLTTYGATEFAGGVAGWSLADHREWGERKRGSVGRAHPGCELRIVDGLLEVRSEQLGPGSGWVRTTDRAELDADGFLWILGRSDDAIVRGGFKILPGEVQAVLERHPAVREASVVGLADARLGAVPVAAVELEAGAQVAAHELLDFARARLASYQLPAKLCIVRALPRTPSLKVSQPDVRALFAEREAPC
jgi:long-chain acyl-CoA synthetase